MKYPIRIWRDWQTTDWLKTKLFYDTPKGLVWFKTELTQLNK